MTDAEGEATAWNSTEDRHVRALAENQARLVPRLSVAKECLSVVPGL